MKGTPAAFEMQLQYLKAMYEEKIPFNKILGFEVESLQVSKVVVRFAMRADLIGNYFLETLHGGVISSVLDATGGLSVSVSLLEKLQGEPVEEIEKRISHIGTIDLRVDYLRPGRGKTFRAVSAIMRTGKKVAVTRMELHNDESVLVAVGTGTYIVG
ncbi:MAG: thioesterase family protein [Desulfobacterales bacterium]|nr:thioesterase family protein [Desulfobacterales bacterium]